MSNRLSNRLANGLSKLKEETSNSRTTYEVKQEGTSKTIQDGGSEDAESAPRSIPYPTDKTILSQGKDPTCGPTCCCMILNDEGIEVNLNDVVNKFNVRKTGVNIIEMSDVLKEYHIDNTYVTDLSPHQLDDLANKKITTIVQVTVSKPNELGNITTDNHFILVDSIQYKYGVKYYNTRDPYKGESRGVRWDYIMRFMSGNAVILKK